MSLKAASTFLLACSATSVLLAQPPARRTGDHPAVVVQRLRAQQGYDFAAQFYPHPAWLYLVAEAPRPTAAPASALAGTRQPPDGEHHAPQH